tara:strand:+ start:269 stop:613 length:345 start_codon:yes stop_codon:yes gene_type:complete
MVDYNLITVIGGESNKKIALTSQEQAFKDAEEKAWTDNSANRKLEIIKQLRLEKLQATDWMSNSDVTMPDYIKTWRQTLRDLPANHTNENAYDLLLARDSDNKLTHSVWTQPTS